MIEKTAARLAAEANTMGVFTDPSAPSGFTVRSVPADPGLTGENTMMSATAESFSVAELASKSNNQNLMASHVPGTPSDRPGNLRGSAMEALPAQLSAGGFAADSLRRCDEGNI